MNFFKKIDRYSLLISRMLIFTVIILAMTMRFFYLDNVPEGFSIDEITSSITIQCLATEGIDASNTPYPFFSDLGFGTPQTPVYIYPAVLWTKIFGFSITSFRAFTVFCFTLTLVGLFLLARRFWGWEYAVWVLLLASISPWTWFLSRLAYEPSMALFYFIWGTYFFFYPTTTWSMILSGLFFSACIYAYPPMQLFVPLILALLFVYKKYMQKITVSQLILFGVALFFSLLPFMIYLSSPSQTRWFNEITILSASYWQLSQRTFSFSVLVLELLKNYFSEFNPGFLWRNAHGEKFTYTSTHFGLLGWLEALSLISGIFFMIKHFLIRRKNLEPTLINRPYCFFLIVGIVIGIIPVAFINPIYGVPSGNRVMGAWAFAYLFFGYWIWVTVKRWPRLVHLYSLTALLFTSIFFHFYFTQYRRESIGLFRPIPKYYAKSAKTEEDWTKFMLRYRFENLTCRLYMMMYHGDSCSSSYVQWGAMKSVLKRFSR